MTVSFPVIQPTDMGFDPPEWPISEAVSMSGIRSYRLLADKPSGATLRLEFANITDVNKLAIDTAHQSAKGPLDDVSLPAIFFNGVTDSALVTFLEQGGSGAKWYFIQGSPPSSQRVRGRRWTVTVPLRAELRL